MGWALTKSFVVGEGWTWVSGSAAHTCTCDTHVAQFMNKREGFVCFISHPVVAWVSCSDGASQKDFGTSRRVMNVIKIWGLNNSLIKERKTLYFLAALARVKYSKAQPATTSIKKNVQLVPKKKIAMATHMKPSVAEASSAIANQCCFEVPSQNFPVSVQRCEIGNVRTFTCLRLLKSELNPRAPHFGMLQNESAFAS